MYPKIFLFGDSITEYGYEKPSGILSNLANTYMRKVDIFARGLSGYNTEMAKPYFPQFIGEITDEIIAVVIFFGTNDAVAPWKHHEQHIPVEQYKANLSEMIDTAFTRSKLVIITGPTLVDENGSDDDSCKIRSNEWALQYSKAASEVAVSKGARFIDLYSRFREANGDPTDLLQPVPGQVSYEGPKSVRHLVHDGVHFTGEAYDIWYDSLLEVLRSEKKGPENFEYLIPDYRSILGMSPKQR